MARVAVYTHVHRRNAAGVVVESVALAPGDEVPEWAHVGQHVLAPDDNDAVDAPDDNDAVDAPDDNDAVDAPAKGRRRTSK